MLEARPADARKLEQVVDEVLHADGALAQHVDVALALLVKLLGVVFGDESREGLNPAQRLLQVMRDAVREVLELRINARQLLCLVR